MRWTVPVQNFPRAIVEHRLHALDLPPRDVLELGAGGKELAQQSIGVFVGPALPWAMGMRKVNLHLRLLREEPVLTHFWALIIGERAAELRRQRAQLPREGPPDGQRVLGFQRHEQRKPRGPFHQCAQRRGIGVADQQIAFPMSRHRAVCVARKGSRDYWEKPADGVEQEV